MSNRTVFHRAPQGGRINDVNLIRHRTTHNGNQIRNYLELMSEDKASRYRLEETHCSIPGSVKSTFLITFSPDGQRVASTHGDHRIYICDLTTGKLLETLEGHPRTPWCLAWHPINKEILASGCLAGEVRVWDLRSKACETWSTEQNSVIASLAFHPRERVLVIATSNEIHFWDWSLSKPFATASTSYEKEKVRFVKFDSSGTKLITGISNLPKLINYSAENLQNRMLDGYSGSSAPLFDFSERQDSSNESQSDAINSSSSSSPPSSTPSGDSITVNGQQRPIGTTTQNSNSHSVHPTNRIANDKRFSISKIASMYHKLERFEDSSRIVHQAISGSLRADLTDVTPNVDEPNSVNPVVSNSEPSTSTSYSCRDSQPSDSSRAATSSGTQFDTTRVRPSHQNNNNHSNNRRASSNSAQIGSACVDIQSRSFEDSLNELYEHVRRLSNIQDRQTSVRDDDITSNQVQDSIVSLDPSQNRLGRILTSLKLYCHLAHMTALSGQEWRQAHNTGHSNQLITAPSVITSEPASFSDSLTVHQHTNQINHGSHQNTDPVFALQFRSSARNVPLTNACRLPLLCARLSFITQSQLIVEQTMEPSVSANQSSFSNTASRSTPAATSSRSNVKGGHFLRSSQSVRVKTETESSSESARKKPNARSTHEETTNSEPQPPHLEPMHSVLNRLLQALQDMNCSTLTVYVAREHINRVRRRIEELLQSLTSFDSNYSDQSRHIHERILYIAQRLTGRTISSPIGERIEDSRLDLIHCLCLADLTIHFARQVQFVQMLVWGPQSSASGAITGQLPHGSSTAVSSGSNISDGAHSQIPNQIFDQSLYRFAIESSQQLLHITANYASRSGVLNSFDPSLFVARLASEPPVIDPIAPLRDSAPLVITPSGHQMDTTNRTNQASAHNNRRDNLSRSRPNHPSLKRKSSCDESRDSGTKKRRIAADYRPGSLPDQASNGQDHSSRDPSLLSSKIEIIQPEPNDNSKQTEQPGPSEVVTENKTDSDNKRIKFSRTVSTRSMTRAHADRQRQTESATNMEVEDRPLTSDQNHDLEPSRPYNDDIPSRMNEAQLSGSNIMTGLMPALIVPPIHQISSVQQIPRRDTLIGPMPVLRLIGAPYYTAELGQILSSNLSTNQIREQAVSESNPNAELRQHVLRPHSQFLLRIYPRTLGMSDQPLGLIRTSGRFLSYPEDGDTVRQEITAEVPAQSARPIRQNIGVAMNLSRASNPQTNGPDSSHPDNRASPSNPTHGPSANSNLITSQPNEVNTPGNNSRSHSDPSVEGPRNSGSSAGSAIWRSIPLTGSFVTRDSGRASYLHMQQAPGGQHLWWNTFGLTAVPAQSNYRIQCWDFKRFNIPNIKDSKSNIVSRKCRIHNDASIDISNDGQLLACLVPQDNTCAPSIDFKIFSLNANDFGTCYYRWSYGPNAISVSISPLGQYVVVGLTCQKLFASESAYDTMVIAQIFKLNTRDSMQLVRNISINRHDYLMSLNSIRWLPQSGQGFIYGTNRGQLIIARPVSKMDKTESDVTASLDNLLGSQSNFILRQNNFHRS